ncbi:DPP IV N-terminal domain-containing protein [bacterium]|nr:DPP IV N-terminal domain-containing protein [bacterium]
MTPNTENSQTTLSRYLRAEALEHLASPMALHAQVRPHWIGDSNHFWYTRIRDSSTEYRRVNASTATNTDAFDHKKLAKALADATGEPISESALPISNLEFDETAISFDAFDKRWQFDGEIKNIERSITYPSHWLLSPDSKKSVFLKDHNLWLHDLETGSEKALTTDGAEYHGYAIQPEGRNLVDGLGAPKAATTMPEAMWSPDSSQLFTVQLDERRVGTMPSILYVPQDGSLRPKAVECKYSLPGDKNIAEYRFLIINIESGHEVKADYASVEDSFIWHGVFSGNRAWWSGDSKTAYFLDMARGQKSVRVVDMRADTGRTRVLFEEHAKTYLEIGHNFEAPTVLVPIPATDELIWFSQRSGTAHLYLYDLKTGELKNPITSGDWSIRDALYFDADSREVIVQIMGRVEGRNYYYREIARVHIDSGEMTLIASSDHDYEMYNDYGGLGSLSPDGQYVVATYSRIDTPPITELRDKKGDVILTLETMDESYLPQNWQWPEPVKTVAADGKTSIYGVIFRPTDFDSEKSYPVLDFCHSNSFFAAVPKHAFSTFYYETAAAFAELGIIVVMMDGRGTSFRDKAFRDFGYDNFLENGGIVDRVAGIKQLAERYPYMDLNRVGIVDYDGSNAGVTGLLAFPDFYQVGVAGTLYDPRLVKQGEVYSGLITEEKRNQTVIWDDVIHNLKGKLFINTGLRDPFFHPCATFQLTDALIKANKDFEHLVHPNGNHAWRLINSRRRIWDYLVRHLVGVNPPSDFKLTTGLEINWPEQITETLLE